MIKNSIKELDKKLEKDKVNVANQDFCHVPARFGPLSEVRNYTLDKARAELLRCIELPLHTELSGTWRSSCAKSCNNSLFLSVWIRMEGPRPACGSCSMGWPP